MSELLQAAVAWAKTIFSVIPVGSNKKLRVQWRDCQTNPWTVDRVERWWAGHRLHERGASLDDTQLWIDTAWGRFESRAKGRDGRTLGQDQGLAELFRARSGYPAQS